MLNSLEKPLPLYPIMKTVIYLPSTELHMEIIKLDVTVSSCILNHHSGFPFDPVSSEYEELI